MTGHARGASGRCDNKSKAEGGDRRARARAASLGTDTRRMKKKLPSRRFPLLSLLLPWSVNVAARLRDQCVKDGSPEVATVFLTVFKAALASHKASETPSGSD